MQTITDWIVPLDWGVQTAPPVIETPRGVVYGNRISTTLDFALLLLGHMTTFHYLEHTDPKSVGMIASFVPRMVQFVFNCCLGPKKRSSVPIMIYLGFVILVESIVAFFMLQEHLLPMMVLIGTILLISSIQLGMSIYANRVLKAQSRVSPIFVVAASANQRRSS